MQPPLSHLKVLDLTRLLPGGFCTLLLADLGADVLKIEEPGKGDYIRWMPPMRGDVAAGHLALNRGKRSMTLNLKHQRGLDVFLRLAEDADVVVESFRPGVMDRLGAGYDTLRARNPRLVYCAITGYGQDGPYRDRAGHDINYLGYAGVLSVMGEAGRGPVVPGVQIADIGGGALIAATGILAAVADAARTGEGRAVDVSMMDGAFSWLSIHAQAYLFTGEVPRRGEMRLSGEFACYNVYRCADGGWVTVGALEPQFWATLCRALGAPELIELQFAPGEAQADVKRRLADIFATRSRDAWVKELAELDACVGPVKDVDEAFEDEHVRARGMITSMPGADDPLRVLGNPVRVSGGGAPARSAPAFGEHTEDVLRALGHDDGAIARLREAGAI